MNRLLLATALVIFPTIGLCQGDLPLSAVNEALRRGDSVQHVGSGNQDAGEMACFAALSTPADDSNKWFISVVTTRGCKQCNTLKSDFENDSYLQAWANTKDASQSWSHFKVYRIEDQTQKSWRFAGLKITSFPAIVIQPPLNGTYGPDGSHCRIIYGYNGSPKQLAATIRARLDEYVIKYRKTNKADGLVARGDNTRTDKYGPPPFAVPEDEDSRPFTVTEEEEVNSMDAATMGAIWFFASLIGSLLIPAVKPTWEKIRAWRKSQSLPVVREDLYVMIQDAIEKLNQKK